MNFMKKWQNTYKHNLDNITYNKPYHSAGHINTSSAGTMIGLILESIRMVLFGHGVAPARLHGRSAPAFSAAASESSLRTPFGYFASIALITFIIASCLTNHTASATASTLSLSVSDDTISMDIAATRANGTFMKSTNTTITASTTNATGYELRVAASNATNPSALINTTDTNAKLNSISSATTEAQFKALAGTTYNGKWGYLPSKYNSSANSDFLPAPTTTGDIINQTNCANGVSPCPVEDNYTLAIGARVDSSIKLGTYNNTFVILATANAIPYSITYDDNVVSNMPTDISSSSVSTTVPIASNIPVRAGYTFLGWCTVVPTNNNGTDVCTGGTQYAAGANWTIDQTGTNNLHLYAMWGKSLGNCTSKATCMQFMDRYTLSTLLPTVGSSTTLYDMRDGQAYTVALLADGKYWMVENLNLAGGTTLHFYDTDMPEGYTLPTANNFQANNTLPASTTTGFNDNTKAFVYNTGNDTDTCTDPGCYSYYSWTAATLGSGLSLSTENADAPYSICPKGWRLPTSGRSANNEWKRGDFYALATAYGDLSSNYYQDSATFYNNAGPGTTPNFLLAGRYSNGSFLDDGYGLYWSATSHSSTSNARDLNFSSGRVNSAGIHYRRYGFSLRCLFGS